MIFSSGVCVIVFFCSSGIQLPGTRAAGKTVCTD